MPDLTIETLWSCSSNHEWSADVELSPGHRYKVTFGRIFGGKYPYGYQCECKGYRFGKGRQCRHIKHVVHNQLRCGWQGRLAIKKRDVHCCPKCGRFVESVKVAV